MSRLVIPKEGTAFQFVLDGKIYTLFGDSMKQKSYMRGKKVKQQSSIPFFLK